MNAWRPVAVTPAAGRAAACWSRRTTATRRRPEATTKPVARGPRRPMARPRANARGLRVRAGQRAGRTRSRRCTPEPPAGRSSSERRAPASRSFAWRARHQSGSASERHSRFGSQSATAAGASRSWHRRWRRSSPRSSRRRSAHTAERRASVRHAVGRPRAAPRAGRTPAVTGPARLCAASGLRRPRAALPLRRSERRRVRRNGRAPPRALPSSWRGRRARAPHLPRGSVEGERRPDLIAACVGVRESRSQCTSPFDRTGARCGLAVEREAPLLAAR